MGTHVWISYPLTLTYGSPGGQFRLATYDLWLMTCVFYVIFIRVGYKAR